MPQTLKQKYGKLIQEASNYSVAPGKIDESNIFQPANMKLREYFNILLNDNLLPESGISNTEHFKDFYNQVKNGKTGLILMEHYSNFDLPAIIYLLEKNGEDWAKDFAQNIVAVAGMKLNEDSLLVRCLTEAYSRVVIYPTRSLEKFEGSQVSEEAKIEEEKRARKINFASMRKMDELKKEGKVILVFPSGTRYRPGKPETKKGLKEIDSYLRLFDIVLPVTINGICLAINPEAPEDMTSDLVLQDVMTLTAHPVLECKAFRKQVLDSLPQDEPDPKQKIIDKIMEILEIQHNQIEESRSK